MRWWFVVAIAGCGRLGFDPISSGDGGGDDGASAGQFCDTVTPTPTMCADFDHGQPIATGFNSTMIENAGLTLADMGNDSGHSALSAFPDQMAGETSIASLQYTPAIDAGIVTFAYDMLLVSRPTLGNFEVNNVAVTVPGVGVFYNDLDLFASSPDTFHEEFAPMPNMNMTHDTSITGAAGITAGVWHHVVMTLDFAEQTYALELDHVVVSSGTSSWSGIAPGPIEVDAGLDWATGGIPGVSLYVDNVTVTVVPFLGG